MREDTEYAAWASHMSRMRLRSTEDARRLARYDEMFSLLKEAANDGWFSNKDLHDRLQAFLAAEGKVAG